MSPEEKKDYMENHAHKAKEQIFIEMSKTKKANLELTKDNDKMAEKIMKLELQLKIVQASQAPLQAPPPCNVLVKSKVENIAVKTEDKKDVNVAEEKDMDREEDLDKLSLTDTVFSDILEQMEKDYPLSPM